MAFLMLTFILTPWHNLLAHFPFKEGVMGSSPIGVTFRDIAQRYSDTFIRCMLQVQILLSLLIHYVLVLGRLVARITSGINLNSGSQTKSRNVLIWKNEPSWTNGSCLENSRSLKTAWGFESLFFRNGR